MPVTVSVPAKRTPAVNAVARSAVVTDQTVSVAARVTLVAPVMAEVYAVSAAISSPDAMSVTVRAPKYLMPLLRSALRVLAATDNVPSAAANVTLVAPVFVVENVVEAAVSSPEAMSVTARVPTRRTPSSSAVFKVEPVTDQAPSAVSVTLVAPVAVAVNAVSAAVSSPFSMPVTVSVPAKRTPAANAVVRFAAVTDQTVSVAARVTLVAPVMAEV